MPDVGHPINDEPAEDARAAALANRYHIDLLVNRRQRLDSLIAEAFRSTVGHVGKASWERSERLSWWEWSRNPHLKLASTQMSEALRTPIADLSRWKRCPPWVGTTISGSFPVITKQPLPTKTPCVYMLMADSGECLYVGMSHHVRNRLNQHWFQKRVPATRWQVVCCESAHGAMSLEGDLIFQHQPRFNSMDRNRRRYVRSAP